MIALDTETELFAPSNMAPRLVCVSFSDGAKGTVMWWDGARGPLQVLLEGHPQVGPGPIVGHNIAFDMAVLAVQWPDLLPPIFEAYEADRVEDTAIRAKLIDLAAGSLGWGSIDHKRVKFKYSLAELSARHLGVHLEKEDTWRLRYGELRDIPIAHWPADAVQYAQDDAHAAAHVWQYQEQFRDILADQHRQARADFWIRLMSIWGMTTSPEAVRAFADKARRNYDALAAELVAAGLKRPDRRKRNGDIEEGARDTKKAMARLVAAFAARGESPPMTEGTEKSPPRVSTSDDACIKSGDPLLMTYGQFGKASKVLTNDVRGLFEKYGSPIHANFEVLLETGDIGCSSPNLVNLPTRPGVRECFVPRPGFVFLACDYSGIQLRTWAQVCIWMLGYSKMAEMLNAGGDPHRQIAADLLGISYDEAMGRPSKIDEPGTIYFERQCGKTVNFGKPGGMGIDRLIASASEQYQITITRAQAEHASRVWLRWPEARPYLDMVRDMTAGGRRIQIRQFKSERLRGGLGYCDTANGLFSALSYDALKAAGWAVSRACYVEREHALFGSRIVNAIHDELILEVPEERGHECADELGVIMRREAQEWIPDVRVDTEATLMRRWSKGAKALHDASGRLIPWDWSEAA